MALDRQKSYMADQMAAGQPAIPSEHCLQKNRCIHKSLHRHLRLPASHQIHRPAAGLFPIRLMHNGIGRQVDLFLSGYPADLRPVTDQNGIYDPSAVCVVHRAQDVLVLGHRHGQHRPGQSFNRRVKVGK